MSNPACREFLVCLRAVLCCGLGWLRWRRLGVRRWFGGQCRKGWLIGGLAGRTARRLAGEPEAWRPDPELTAHYDAIVRRSFEAVSEYTGLPLELGSDEVRVLGRADWIDANLVNFERLLAPLAVAYQHTRTGSGALGRVAAHGTRFTVTGQIALLLGYLGRRVLGQYDIPILDAEAEFGGYLFRGTEFGAGGGKGRGRPGGAAAVGGVA